MSGQGARVDSADTDDPGLDQVAFEAALGAPAGRANGRVAHDEAGDPDAVGLVVLVVDAGVADMRGGHHDYLTVVARVSQCLLVTAHAGREDGFAHRLANRPVDLTCERAAILQDEHRRLAGLESLLRRQTSFPFRTVGTPCR